MASEDCDESKSSSSHRVMCHWVISRSCRVIRMETSRNDEKMAFYAVAQRHMEAAKVAYVNGFHPMHPSRGVGRLGVAP